MSLKAKLLSFFFLILGIESLAQNSKYFGQVEIGFLYGRSEEQWDENHEERVDVSLMTFHGIQVTKNHVIGLSTGLDQYEGISIIPIALGWRGFLGKDGKPKVFGGLDLGGGSTMLEKKENDTWSKSWYQGGLMVSPSIGASFPAKKGNYALTFTFAYKSQEISQFRGTLLQPGAQSLTNDLLPPGYSAMQENNFLYRSFVFRAGLLF